MTAEEEGPAELDLMSIKDAFSSLLRLRGLGGVASLAALMSVWEEAVGSEVAGKVRPVALRHDELVVEVDSPAWATQVSLLSEQLLDQLAQAAGTPLASRLSARVNPRSNRKN